MSFFKFYSSGNIYREYYKTTFEYYTCREDHSRSICVAVAILGIGVTALGGLNARAIPGCRIDVPIARVNRTQSTVTNFRVSKLYGHTVYYA